MFNDEGEKIGGRWTLHYEGFLFEGDSDGWNHHDFDRYEDVMGIIKFYKNYGMRFWLDDNY